MAANCQPAVVELQSNCLPSVCIVQSTKQQSKLLSLAMYCSACIDDQVVKCTARTNFTAPESQLLSALGVCAIICFPKLSQRELTAISLHICWLACIPLLCMSAIVDKRGVSINTQHPDWLPSTNAYMGSCRNML